MEDKRKLNLVLLVLNGSFTGICICLLISLLLNGQANLMQSIEIVADIIACIYAAIYLFEGCSKGYAKHYKLCMIVSSINSLAVTVLSIKEKVPYISTVMCATAFVLTTILACTKDLGKKSSYMCCGFLVFVRLSGLISNVITETNNPQFNIIITLLVSQLSLALLIGVVTYAKYTDKKNRESK